MKKRKVLCLVTMLVFTSSIIFTGCSLGNDGEKNDGSKDNNTDQSSSNELPGNKIDKLQDVFTNFDQNDTWGMGAKEIELSSGDVEIFEEGTYILKGTLEDGQIYVEVDDEQKVQIVLNGVNITCNDSAAIFVENADKVSITLAEGTENVVNDGGSEDSTDADGCIYSKDDLSINGKGKLVVNGNVTNGIDCNNDIKITGGEIEVNAVNNGIKAKESISIKDGNIIVKAEDCIKASSNSDDTVGTFYMEGGNLDLHALDDGISATVSVTVYDGEILMDVADKEINCDGKENISEGCISEK